VNDLPPQAQLVVIAKAPRAGFVKTRLCPPYTPRQAAELAAAALSDTLGTVAKVSARGVIAGAVLALDGHPGLVDIPDCFDVVAQVVGGLDSRLAGAFDDAYLIRRAPMLLIGMDTPQVTESDLADACGFLLADGVDAVMGPATDGGFWALGLRAPDPRLLLDVPMSTSRTGEAQLDRLRAFGLRVALLAELRDVDDAAGADSVAVLAPESRFAIQLRQYEIGVAS
jgi:rSAM/selenodomain-associated transferase 1